jgi:hypothetical protein
MNIKMVPLPELFTIKTGDYHATSELEAGEIPLVSCGETNNGVIGNFDIPINRTYKRCLTIAYNGTPLLTKFHPYRFGAKDDVGVLMPKKDMNDNALVYFATVLSRETWRYSYGRKCFSNKIPLLKVPTPIDADGDIDESWIDSLFHREIGSYIPKSAGKNVAIGKMVWQRIPLAELFNFDNGDFNSYGEFPPGQDFIVSRSAENNGVAGHYEVPARARKFPIGAVTVSTVTGDAFVQLHDFFASDKVVILTPKKRMRPAVLFFLAFAINQQRWRFSYGRSCFHRTISLSSVGLPTKADGTLDEDTMENAVAQSSYWHVISRRFQYESEG